MFDDPRMKTVRIAGFWLAAAFAFVMATLPHPPQLPGEPTDKVQHILAFAVLTILALSAYPRTPWGRVVLCLIAFGGLIELVQAIPALHRDSDWRDWLADAGAVLAALAVVQIVHLGWRRRASR